MAKYIKLLSIQAVGMFEGVLKITVKYEFSLFKKLLGNRNYETSYIGNDLTWIEEGTDLILDIDTIKWLNTKWVISQGIISLIAPNDYTI